MIPPLQGTVHSRGVIMEVHILTLPCVHVKICFSYTVADPSTLYVQELPCVYI